jgi:hypothetical protein
VSDPRTWGVSEDDCREFPCDALGFAYDEAFYRGIDIAAPAPLVYRWLCQLRAAPYSYDALDNFGRPSPSRLTPGLDRLETGQRIMLIFRLAAFDYGHSLTIALNMRAAAAVMGDIAGSYVVVPTEAGARLLTKVLVRYPHGPYGGFLRRVLPGLDLFMFKEQLRRLKRYAERDAKSLRAGRKHTLENV